LIEQAGEVPPVGYIFNYSGYEFKVIESNDRHISRVEIRKIDSENQEN